MPEFDFAHHRTFDGKRYKLLGYYSSKETALARKGVMLGSWKSVRTIKSKTWGWQLWGHGLIRGSWWQRTKQHGADWPRSTPDRWAH